MNKRFYLPLQYFKCNGVGISLYICDNVMETPDPVGTESI
jgi:hypothetical protein